MRCSVLVIGAGPVGLTAAMDLAWRGIDVTVVELRHRGEPPNVKCNHVAARSMEIFRRLGVANALRNTGLPEDYANDISYRTTTLGTELTRIRIPCRRDRFTDRSGPDGDWPTPEPPHRINQIFLEPVLFAHAEAMPGITILNRCALEIFAQDETGVTATVRNLDTSTETTIRAAYLIGADGARSLVRRGIGASFQGDPVVQRVQSTYIHAPELLRLIPDRPAWVMFSLNPRRSGNVMAIDGRERWLIHNYLRDDEPDFDSVDRDWAIRTIIGAPPDFRYDIITKEDWFGRRLVADRFRDRRAFIAGDAAHIWVPYAGYGMNAGIADATNLTWQIAAVLKGWADPALLDAYEAERHPITEQVSVFAMNHSAAMARTRREVPDDIEAPGPEGDAIRARVGQASYDLNVTQYCCAGLNFGSYYDRSPIIARDGEAAPPYSMGSFTPSTVPGCRLPHLWLRDGTSLYDTLSPDYTLLRFIPSADPEPLLREAAGQGLPLALLDVDAPDTTPYRHALVIARPDQHVAWRGDSPPAATGPLIGRLRGAAPP
jgi:2-polyprenyl-6-methoxyphenol hydroxylase-like FAD-dependent oxidoreductase